MVDAAFSSEMLTTDISGNHVISIESQGQELGHSEMLPIRR